MRHLPNAVLNIPHLELQIAKVSERFAVTNSCIRATDVIHTMQMPEHAGYLSPILHTVPLQLLAYYSALQNRRMLINRKASQNPLQ